MRAAYSINKWKYLIYAIILFDLQVLDYTQYFMDLKLANTLGEPNWVPEYNLTHYYALSDVSAISLHNFVDRFTGSDTSWFAKYVTPTHTTHNTKYTQSHLKTILSCRAQID